ncbi:hypothetical protein O6P43_016851 [Quillaja saponaria]|uniref:Uncharacterized protein n=1 Tax=Quillaja saponaria TaxID=32244 RepID=A0AAD7LNY6_QUISA|nr:hypothetical protein O6P43_016851 [Quillaja saponaria]
MCNPGTTYFDARFQAVMDAIASLALKVTGRVQQSPVRVREPILPTLSTNSQNPNLPQPPTLTAEVDKIKIATPPRTLRKEIMLQEFLSPKDDKHEREIQVGYQFIKL